MNVREWVIEEHASIRSRFDQSIGGVVPPDVWTDQAGAGGSSIAWLLFHVTLHEDIAVNAVLRRVDPIVTSARSALGLADVSPAVGLGETEQPDVSERLDVPALLQYVARVHDATQLWLATETDQAFDAVLRSDADGPSGLARAGIDGADVPWLYRMWSAKPGSFFVQWEAIGHRINHVGEMVSVRNRLGLSPF